MCPGTVREVTDIDMFLPEFIRARAASAPAGSLGVPVDMDEWKWNTSLNWKIQDFESVAGAWRSAKTAIFDRIKHKRLLGKRRDGRIG